jgi:hypothetical protein
MSNLAQSASLYLSNKELTKYPHLKQELTSLSSSIEIQMEHAVKIIITKELLQARSFLKWEAKNSKEIENASLEEKWKLWTLDNKDKAQKRLAAKFLLDDPEIEDNDDPICKKCGHRASEHPVKLE